MSALHCDYCGKPARDGAVLRSCYLIGSCCTPKILAALSQDPGARTNLRLDFPPDGKPFAAWAALLPLTRCCALTRRAGDGRRAAYACGKAATHLLHVTVPGWPPRIRPRCAGHPAEEDAAVILALHPGALVRTEATAGGETS